MRKKIVSLILLLCLALCSNSAFANEPITETAVIDGKTSDRVHLRERPSVDSKSYGLYFTGTTVQSETFTNQEWVWVSIGTQSGYIKSEFLQFGTNANTVTPKQPIGTVSNKNSNTWTNLRSDPSLNADVVKRLYNGDTATILGETVTKWYYVNVGDVYGYVMVDFMSMGGSVSSGKPTSPPAPPAPPSSGTAALDAYKSVMQNTVAFVNTNTNQSMYFSELTNMLSNSAIGIPYFAVVDLDGNTIPEIILLKSTNGTEYGVEILRYQDGTVYGYELSQRAFMQLKADGTFSYSNGAADNGFGRMSFDKNSQSLQAQTYCQSSSSGISYYVNRLATTENAFSAAIEAQERKSDASWYEFSVANAEVVISGYRFGT